MTIMQDIGNRDFLFGATRELLDLMARGTTHQETDVTRRDPAIYFSEERFLAEKNELFRKTPLVLALSCELPNPGDFKLHEETGVPLLLTRDRAGRCHVFLNACRHRAVKVADKPCGNASRFTCPYHAWTYGGDGSLLALPGEDIFGDVDKAALGLVEFPSEEKYGLIFGVLTPDAHIDVDAFLGDGVRHIAGWRLDRNKLVAERPLETKANWKLALDTYTENYHFHVLHSADFGYKVKNCAMHWRFGERGRHWILAWPSKSLEELRNVPEERWGQVNDHFSMLYYIFPNTIIALYPETCSIKHIYPGDSVGEQTTRMKFYARTPNPSEDLSRYVNERLELFYKVLQKEDYLVCGQAWENIRTGLIPELLYGRNEPALTWLHQALDEAMDEINDAPAVMRAPERCVG